MKIPLKIKKMWYMCKEVVLTKDNLARRKWGGSKQYSFCLHNETIQHLLFLLLLCDITLGTSSYYLHYFTTS
jgi:hypothetical protein